MSDDVGIQPTPERTPLWIKARSRVRKGYHLLPSVCGDLLGKLGRFDEARAEFERAASLTRNAREREPR